MAKITVVTPAAVMYDGRLLYQSATEYAVNDTYANYVKATADRSAGLIAITEAFTITDDPSDDIDDIKSAIGTPAGASLADDIDDIESAIGTPAGASLAADIADVLDATNRFGKGYKVTKTITYTGETSYAAFDVTGLVAAKIIGHITTPLTNDAAETSVGIIGLPGIFIPATAGTAMQTDGQIWNTNAPANAVSLDSAYYLTGEDIVVTSDANLTAGKVELYCYWYPISEDGAVVAAE